MRLYWTSGVAVNMSPCHGEDRGFDSRLVRQSFIFINTLRPDNSAGRVAD